MNCQGQNDINYNTSGSFGNGFLIVVVLYILLAIIIVYAEMEIAQNAVDLTALFLNQKKINFLSMLLFLLNASKLWKVRKKNQ